MIMVDRLAGKIAADFASTVNLAFVLELFSF
jgi:hypothetical protein